MHREKCIFTQILLQRDDFAVSNLKITQKPKQAGVLLQRNACARRVFSYGHFHRDILLNIFPVADMPMAQRVQQAYAKSQFHHSF